MMSIHSSVVLRLLSVLTTIIIGYIHDALTVLNDCVTFTSPSSYTLLSNPSQASVRNDTLAIRKDSSPAVDFKRLHILLPSVFKPEERKPHVPLRRELVTEHAKSWAKQMTNGKTHCNPGLNAEVWSFPLHTLIKVQSGTCFRPQANFTAPEIRQ